MSWITWFMEMFSNVFRSESCFELPNMHTCALGDTKASCLERVSSYVFKCTASLTHTRSKHFYERSTLLDIYSSVMVNSVAHTIMYRCNVSWNSLEWFGKGEIANRYTSPRLHLCSFVSLAVWVGRGRNDTARRAFSRVHTFTSSGSGSHLWQLMWVRAGSVLYQVLYCTCPELCAPDSPLAASQRAQNNMRKERHTSISLSLLSRPVWAEWKREIERTQHRHIYLLLCERSNKKIQRCADQKAKSICFRAGKRNSISNNFTFMGQIRIHQVVLFLSCNILGDKSSIVHFAKKKKQSSLYLLFLLASTLTKRLWQTEGNSGWKILLIILNSSIPWTGEQWSNQD